MKAGIVEEATPIDAPLGQLRGTIVRPAGRGKHPAVVMIAGAGTSARTRLTDEAHGLAERGVVAMVYGKRAAGYSVLRRDYATLADDALAGADALREHPAVNAARVGLCGFSEGGWVAPLAVSRAADDIAFLVLVSAPNVSPLDQATWMLDGRLRRSHAPRALRHIVTRGLASGLGRVNYLDHEPRPALATVRAPILGIYGADDTAVAVHDAIRNLHTSATVSEAVRSAVFAHGNHCIRTPRGSFAPGYLDTIAAWILRFSAEAREDRIRTGKDLDPPWRTPS